MRTGILLFCGIILALSVWLLLHRSVGLQKLEPDKIVVLTVNQQQTNSPQQSAMMIETKKTDTNILRPIPYGSVESRSNRVERSYDPWRTPIEFYGMVIDESNNPVTDADIIFDCNDLSEKGTSFYHKKSDVSGMFSLTAVRGEGISVHVSKDGYYTSRKDRDNFEYGQSSPYHFAANFGNPVIFHLHKKGQGVQLITSDYGIRPDFPVLVPPDGGPITVNLLQRKIDPSGDLQISHVEPSAQWQQATNWSFHMSMSDGGFIEENDDFPFAAPEAGYQSTIDLNFTKGDASWLTQFTKTYYVVFGQPQKYGWLQVDANMMQQTIVLKYAINPTGSRNLEPK